MNAKGHLLTMIPGVDRLDMIVLAATAGDASTVQQILNHHPQEVWAVFKCLVYILFMTVASKLCCVIFVTASNTG